MTEQKPLTVKDIGNKLVGILDGILATGDWQESLFLKASASRLKELRSEAARLATDEAKKAIQAAEDKAKVRQGVPSGYIQTYVSLYQIDGNNLQIWYRVIKSLTEHSVTRPAYKDETHVQEFIRSKITGIERNGYVVVNIKEHSVYNIEPVAVDAFGHELLTLKEDAIELENIVEFIHANKKRYEVTDQGLVFLGDVE